MRRGGIGHQHLQRHAGIVRLLPRAYGVGGQACRIGQQPCLHLKRSPLQNWNGLLFDGKRDVRADLARLGVAQDLNFDGYMLDPDEVWRSALYSVGIDPGALPSWSPAHGEDEAN